MCVIAFSSCQEQRISSLAGDLNSDAEDLEYDIKYLQGLISEHDSIGLKSVTVRPYATNYGVVENETEGDTYNVELEIYKDREHFEEQIKRDHTQLLGLGMDKMLIVYNTNDTAPIIKDMYFHVLRHGALVTELGDKDKLIKRITDYHTEQGLTKVVRDSSFRAVTAALSEVDRVVFVDHVYHRVADAASHAYNMGFMKAHVSVYNLKTKKLEQEFDMWVQNDYVVAMDDNEYASLQEAVDLNMDRNTDRELRYQLKQHGYKTINPQGARKGIV